MPIYKGSEKEGRGRDNGVEARPLKRDTIFEDISRFISTLIWTDLFKFLIQKISFSFFRGWFGWGPEEDGRGRLLRRRVTLICAGYADRSVQGRMTVLRRGEVPSTGAGPMGQAHVSHRVLAHSPGRTFLHPPSSGLHVCCAPI